MASLLLNIFAKPLFAANILSIDQINYEVVKKRSEPISKFVDEKIKQSIFKILGQEFADKLFGQDFSRLQIRVDGNNSSSVKDPKGNIIIGISKDIYKKIRKFKKLDDASKFVLLHEIGHCAYDHFLISAKYFRKTCRIQMLFAAVTSFLIDPFGNKDVGTTMRIAAGMVVHMSLSLSHGHLPMAWQHAQEYQADNFAVAWLRGSKEASAFFEEYSKQLEQSQKKSAQSKELQSQSKSSQAALGLSASHPSNEDRMKAIKAFIG